jgi:hypothetical protein
MKVTLILVAFSFAQALPGQHVPGETGSLLVRTDIECRLSVDGEPRGILKVSDEVRLSLPLGEHRVEADALSGGPHWQETVKLAAQGQTLSIPLQVAISRAEAQSRGYWTDPQNKLTWAASGYTDWTLPSIDDLYHLFGGPVNQGGYHVTGPLKLTGWEWSASAGKEPGEQWALDFGDGARASVVTGDSGLNRALCVRRAAD